MAKLLTGEEVKTHSTAISLPLNTHTPEKWLFVDLETGQVYRGGKTRGFTRYGTVKRKFLTQGSPSHSTSGFRLVIEEK